MNNWHKSITIDRILEAVQADDCLGICIYCGEDQHGCEPDARKYRCESCNLNGVYGAEELLLMSPEAL